MIWLEAFISFGTIPKLYFRITVCKTWNHNSCPGNIEPSRFGGKNVINSFALINDWFTMPMWAQTTRRASYSWSVC